MRQSEPISHQYADTLMRMYPNPGSFPDPTDTPDVTWGYPQGFLFWGFIRLWERTGETVYRDYVMRFVDVRTGEDGHLTGFVGNSLDDIMTGSLWVWAYRETGKDKYRIAADTVRKAFDAYPRLEDGNFWHGDWCPSEVWIDGLFMGQMFLSKYAAFVPGAAPDFEETTRQLKLTWGHCRKPGTGFLFHAYSENPATPWANPETGCAPEVWSEGLGWYAMILVEVLSVLPETHPDYPEIQAQWNAMAASLMQHQDPVTGLWYQVVDKGDLSDNWHDTSGSAMFTYALARAVELGISDAVVFQPVVAKGYQGICGKVTFDALDGFVVKDACAGLCVQNAYQDYIQYPRVDNAREAVAAVLWATTIVEYGFSDNPA